MTIKAIYPGTFDPVTNGHSDLIERVHKVNFFAPVWIIEFFQKKDPLLNTHIAVVSSSATFIPFPRSEAYGSSKAALTYFIHSLSTDKLNSKLINLKIN